MKNLITGTHMIVSSSDPASDRAFFRDVLGFESVDAGGGWLIFALPPAELAFHPGTNGEHQLYLMTADLDATLSALKAKGVPMRAPISEQAWGRLASIVLPGGERQADSQQDRDPDQITDHEVRAEIVQAVETEDCISGEVELNDDRDRDRGEPAGVDPAHITTHGTRIVHAGSVRRGRRPRQSP